MPKRHYYAFQQSHGGASWQDRDGSTHEAGMLHRFHSSRAAEEWVSQPISEWGTTLDFERRNTRRAVATRNLPHGWTVHPYGGTVYVDHRVDGSTVRVSFEKWLTWRRVEV